MIRKNALTMLVVAACIGLATSNTGAQLAKSGTYTSHFGWHGVVKVSEIDKDRMFLSGEWTGTVFNDAGQGFLHHAAVACPGAGDIVKGIGTYRGYCTATDHDGDKAFMVWKCANAQPGERCDGDIEWTGGTGKYTGLVGKASLQSTGIPKTTSGYARWNGDWRVPQ